MKYDIMKYINTHTQDISFDNDAWKENDVSKQADRTIEQNEKC